MVSFLLEEPTTKPLDVEGFSMHLDQIKLTHTDKHLSGLYQNGWHVGLFPYASRVRSRGGLRFAQEQTCDEAFHHTGHPLVRSIEPSEEWV